MNKQKSKMENSIIKKKKKIINFNKKKKKEKKEVDLFIYFIIM
jgi:hypothetical protein